MYKCTICLLSKSNVRQITELHEGISYAYMTNYVADIKVVEGNKQVICHLCTQKLKDCYFFKLLIIRSYQELNANCKKFKFDSIKDIKAQIFKETHITPSNKKQTQNNTIIESRNDDTVHSERLESAKDKLASIFNLETDNEDEEDTPPDREANEEESFDGEINEEKDIEVVIKKENNKEVNKKSDKKLRKHQLITNVLIKPQYLEGIKMIPAFTKRIRKPVKQTCQPVKKKREDICPYCGIKTKTMKSHLLIHTVSQKFECNDCTRRFYTKSSLEHHVKSHLNEHIYKCDKCVATFNTKGGLKRYLRGFIYKINLSMSVIFVYWLHVQECITRYSLYYFTLLCHLHTHTDVKDHKCHICNKAFRWRHGLHRHILIHNINAKPFRCEVCNMSFLNKYTLKVHTRVHTGERPYNCELCSKPYSYKRDFNRHCLNKHGVLLDRRSVHVMNEETLKREKVLMKDLMLRVHGVPTEREPLDAFRGPQKALAFAKAVKAMQDRKVPIDVQL